MIKDKFTNKEKIVVGLTAVVAIYFLYNYFFKTKTTKKINSPEIDEQLKKDFNFDLIPDGKNNYRSAQITIDKYPEVIKKYGIKNIIRMNGDGGDSKHKSSYPQTSKKEEEEMCKKLGCNYQFINAHEGYKEGKGYTQSLDKVDKILQQGNTLIHCTHGADRTGGMVGGYLKKNNIITDKDKLWDYTTKYNSWNSYIKKGKFFGSGYDKYADTFYPISELKNKFK